MCLPDRWVTKAVAESLRSHSPRAFPVPAFNDSIQNIEELRPIFLQHKTLNSSETHIGNNINLEESCIFSKEFFLTCLKTQLEGISEMIKLSRHVDNIGGLSSDDIEKVFEDNTYM